MAPSETEDFKEQMHDIESSSESSSSEDDDEANGDGDVADARRLETNEEARIYVEIMAVNPETAATPELRKAFKWAQNEFVKARDQSLEYCCRIQELEEQIAELSKPRKRSGNTLEVKIAAIGRQFCYLFRPVVPNYLFPLRGVEPLDPRHPMRYDKPEFMRRCLVTAFVGFLPLELRKAVKTYPNFEQKFLQGARSEIGLFVNTIKTIYPHTYAGLGISAHGLAKAENLCRDPTVLWLLEDPFAPEKDGSDGDSADKPGNEEEEEEEESESESIPTFPRILYQDPYTPT
ncbi:hypothetical protein CONPUDRAFT_159052 [Coniophora puteana RWD-64-598 SS2]|uniref:Uncharacterized protein n=1 Tax=Coniophora puteana (strain RWD-64-598) TaxID=741705 RepID=A0A5M3MAC8_CONPW|nr:uncharacterized protein CONPUDRAFT_159052 [Coniophora puteana RWD-64-598 SS2]EIW75601.1 hypothetical protein CONPUDRAFT_159052 [Coniophora puteana RWD-64-598 SS2]